jgi:hypothetical protein
MARLRRFFSWILLLVVLVASLWTVGLTQATPAQARIRQLEEKPGQFLYQSRKALKDQHGHTWQAIAFKRAMPDGSSTFFLRLVGFPDTATIDRSRPLGFTNSLGDSLEAADASSRIFTDADKPEPHVGQYDLKPLVPDLRAELPWRLDIPTIEGDTVVLQVPPSLVQEWQTVANS